MRSKSLTYMPALDGLRAVAVLLVFVGHSFPEAHFPGGLGVDVFFVLSGFLITLILLKEQERTGTIDLKRFYVRRLLRLYPPLIAVVATTTLLWWALDTTFLTQTTRAGIALTYLSNVVLTVTEAPMGALQHTWSLSMEEQFYLAWPLLLLILLRRGVRRETLLAVTLLFAALSLAGWIVQEGELHHSYNPLTRAGGLLVGCATAILLHRRSRYSPALAHSAVVGFALVVLLGSLDMFPNAYSHPVVILLMPFVIAYCAFGGGALARVLSSRWIVRLGLVSYAFYLWHFPILVLLQFNTPMPDWAIGAIALPVTIVVSELSYRFVETPALRRKDKIHNLRPDVSSPSGADAGPRTATASATLQAGARREAPRSRT
jgi:peptidoglycan/LPS O-acetylase OafA/YrhL